jgi:hypothetical protein
VPPSADGSFDFSLQVVFVKMKNLNVCVTYINRISTEPKKEKDIK